MKSEILSRAELIKIEKRLMGVPFFIAFGSLVCILVLIYSNMVFKNSSNFSSLLTLVEKRTISEFIAACSAKILGSTSIPLSNENLSSQKKSGNSERERLNQSLRELLTDSTVRILAENGSGSGFFINENIVVTNRHVIEKNPDKILLAHPKWNDELLPATLLEMTPPKENTSDLDFAILKLSRPIIGGSFLKLANVAQPLMLVAAAGFPGIITEFDKNRIAPETVFTQGAISVVQKQEGGHALLNHSANIARGNSGGPLVNMCGGVVGVNTFIVREKENIDGRTFYALSSKDLITFLKQKNIPFTFDASECDR